MSGKYTYSGPWFRAGAVFALVSVMTLIISFQQIDFYYLEENNWQGEERTLAEYCDDEDSLAPLFTCNESRFNAQISVVMTLLSIGFTMMCLAQSRYLEKEIENK